MICAHFNSRRIELFGNRTSRSRILLHVLYGGWGGRDPAAVRTLWLRCVYTTYWRTDALYWYVVANIHSERAAVATGTSVHTYYSRVVDQLVATRVP